LKVPEGDPFAGMESGSDFAANQQLPGGAIVHEGGTTVDLTDSPKMRNTLQARVHYSIYSGNAWASKTAGTAAIGGSNSGDATEEDMGIGIWGDLTDATHVINQNMTGDSVSMINLGKPQTDPFAGSTAPALNENAEKIRNLHNEEVN